MLFGEIHVAESTMKGQLQERHGQADARRLAREQRAGAGKQDRFYCGALVHLGGCLVTWGSRLQERYRTAPANKTQTANPLAN